MSQRKILILGGASVHCKLVEAAHEMNLYVIVADYLKKEDSPAKLIADESHEVDINDVETIVGICEREDVEAVISTHLDPCQKPYQKICERLQLPCLGTAQQFDYLTNKRNFKELCRKYHVDVIQDYTENDVHNNQVEYPVFVKPVDSRGSRGQKKCGNKSETLEAIKIAKKESSSGDCIVEKYMDKEKEIQITYFFVNGTPYLIRTADSCRGNEEMGNIITYGISPSQYTLEYLNIAHDNVVEMLKGIGIKNGPVMLQGFYAEGHFRIFDQGLRFPGSDYERIYKKECNVDLLKPILEFSLTGKMPQVVLNSDDVFLNGKQMTIVFPIISAGTIQKIEGLDEIAKDPKVISVWMRHLEGDTITWSNDINHRLCEIDIISEKEEAADMMSQIHSTIKVSDIEGKNMVLDYFDK